MPAVIIAVIKAATIHSFNLIMFSKFYQSIFTQCDNHINSTCADSVHVDAITGTASVLYKDGSIYRYENVSRRAIIKFIMDDARSLGNKQQRDLLWAQGHRVTAYDRTKMHNRKRK